MRLSFGTVSSREDDHVIFTPLKDLKFRFCLIFSEEVLCPPLFDMRKTLESALICVVISSNCFPFVDNNLVHLRGRWWIFCLENRSVSWVEVKSRPVFATGDEIVDNACFGWCC